MVHLYSADRAGPLAERLAEVLVADPGDPMEPLWLAVPTEGMRRWIGLELARYLGSSADGSGDGVTANVVHAYPGTLRSKVLAAATDGDPDPWDIDRMVWPLLEVYEELSSDGREPAFTRLAGGASRFTRVRAVADLFDRYHLHRPDMVRAWAEGRAVDGCAEALPAHLAWQPSVWNRLHERIGTPSPPERLPGLLDAVRRDALELDLPRRLVLFGFTTLPGHEFIELLTAVGTHRTVEVFLIAPCRLDSGDLVRAAGPRPGARPRMRADDRSGDAIAQPLLEVWGRSARETALLLADEEAVGLPVPEWVEDPDLTDRGPTTLLGRLQADIRGNRRPTPTDVDPGDRSIRLHACFGPMREAEVARDAILHLLADDPSLAEEDVLVVCPGLESFAPLVEAAFGPSSTAAAEYGPERPVGAPSLRYRIADRSIRTANPVLGAVADLLQLASGRFEVAPVLDFLTSAPVRERFGFDDATLGVVVDWVATTRVRWGLDTDHRSEFDMPRTVGGNTWRSALDRLLLGAAVSGDGLALAIGDVAPTEVESGDAEVLGSLAAVVGRLAELAEWAGSDRHPAVHWVGRIREVTTALLAAPDGASWQLDALHRMLDELLDASGSTDDGPGPLLDLRDVRRLVDGKIGSEPGRPDFFRGGVTVTSMAPLRWVPYRVVCILGLDQEHIGTPAPDAADLVAAVPRVGDPDRRIEFRQSLLEAVLMAGEHLVVVRNGHDVRSNHPVPRVVAGAELFDAVVLGVPPADRDDLRGRLELSHPRHSFDEACLVRGRLLDDGVWSFDPADRERAAARRTPHVPVGPEARPVVTGPTSDIIELDALRSFLVDPVAAFATASLQVAFPCDEDDEEIDLPVEVGPLELSGLGRRLLDARLAGASDDEWLEVERRIGTLPPGSLEQGVTTTLFAAVGALLTEAARRGVGTGEPELVEIEVGLADGTLLIGSVPLRLAGPPAGPARVLFTRPKPAFELEAWLDLTALVATDPARPWRSLVLSRGAGDDPVAAVDLCVRGDVDDPAAVARDALGVAVHCFRAGMREPLPLFPAVSRSIASGQGDHGTWKHPRGGGDGQRTATAFFYPDLGYRELLDLPPGPSDPDGPGGRVERWAHYLWDAVSATSQAYP